MTARKFAIPPKRKFAEKLLRWFSTAMRPLPWRETYDPYSVWISEIMLQQTQMERGVRYFNAWMKRFPDIRSVAEAGEEEVLAAWEGLGYYSRARNLHAAAKRVVARHGGEFPDSPDAIRALPGIGDYTAGAIAAIAFNLPVPAVDANVMRIFSRICDIGTPLTGKEVKSFIAGAVLALMPDEPRMFVQALMELGALVCGKTPKCGDCPVAAHCAALRRGTVSMRPAKRAEAGRKVLETVACVVFRDGRVFVRKRPQSGLWAGLWTFPGGEIAPGETPERAAERHAAEAVGRPVTVRGEIAAVSHGYTRWRATMRGFFCDAPSGSGPEPSSGGLWVLPGETGRYAFPAGQRKLLERLGWKESRSATVSRPSPAFSRTP